MLPPRYRQSSIGLAVLVSAVVTLAGCGGSTAPATPVVPADLLMKPDALPAGFTPTPLSVTDLVAGNRDRIDAAKSAQITPPDCRPTADAELNKELSQDNSAVLAARGEGATLLELVTTVRRDIDADIRSTTGGCATTTTLIDAGTLRGARIVSRYEQIDPDLGPHAASVQESLALRSEVGTTLSDGTVSNQVGYAGYATVARPGTEPVTVQLTITGERTPASRVPAPAPEPMSRAEFTAAFRDAVTAAAAR
ncbi:hypothetical protein ACWDTI_00955 [Gordonia sp. NPDC003424]